MKKKLALLSLLVAANVYASDEFFYEEGTQAVKLEETVVSTTGFETSIRNIPNNVTIISSKEIEDKNYTSVESALSDIPSVNITQNVFGASVDLRGQGSSTKAKNNVQVLVDGVPLNPLDGDHGTLPLNSVDIESVESIEVIPGGGSILYGGGTSGGVVNIITKSKGNLKANNYVKYENGSYGRSKVAVSAGHNVNENFLIQGTYSGTEEDGYREGTSVDSDYYEVSGRYKINDKQNISLKYGRYEEEAKGATKYLTKEQLEEDRNQNGVRDTDIFNSETTRDEILVTYDGELKENLKLTLDMSYQKTENTTHQVEQIWSPDDNETTIFEDEKLALKPKVKYIYGEGSSLVLGYDFIQAKNNRHYTYEYPSFGMVGTSNYDFTKDTHGVFVLNTYKKDKFEFTQGFRYEYSDYSTEKTNVSKGTIDYSGTRNMSNEAFELAANYLYSDTGNVYTRWESGFTSPSANQLIDKYGDGDYRINNLDSEKFNTFETGIKEYVLGSYIGLTGFYTIKKDEIYNDMNGTSDWHYRNIDETTRKGLEVSLEQYYGKLTLKESYSYIDAEISSGENNGNKIPEVAKNSVTMSARYDYNTKLNAILTLTYKDSYYLNEENEGGKVNDYVTTDLIVNYSVNEDLKLYAGINNLFNEKYFNDVEYDNGDFTYDPAAERSYYGGFKYNF